jgi:hypothetical protein
LTNPGFFVSLYLGKKFSTFFYHSSPLRGGL